MKPSPVPITCFIFLALSWLLNAAFPVYADESSDADTRLAPVLKIRAGHAPYQLGNYLSLFEDPSGRLTIADIRSPEIAARFQPSDVPAPNLGFTRSAVWARLEIVNTLEHRANYFLEIAYPLLDQVTVFIDDRKTLRRYDTGDRRAFGTRLLDHRMFVFPLELEPGQPQTVFLRFQTKSAMNLAALLLSPRQFSGRTAVEYSVLSLYYGVLLMLIIYNLFHYLRLGDKNALYYVIFIGNYIGFQLALNGISFQYFWPNNSWWANANLPFFICTTCLTGTLFTQSILNTRHYTPRIHRLLGVLRWIAGIGAALALLGPYEWAIQYAAILVFALVVFVIAGIRISLMGFRPARYYTLAWAVSLTGMIIYSLKTFGLLPTNVITTWSTQIGSAWDAIILAFAISDRFYLIEYEKRQVRATARAQLAASNRKLNRLNEELESRVEAGLKDLRASNRRLRAEAEVRRIAERKADAANRAKSEFLANMSHEIRTPMNAIMGFVHLLSRSQLGRDQQSFVSKIDQAGRALLGIIKDILDLSKIETGHLALETAPFQTRQLLIEARSLVELTASQKGLTLDLTHDLPNDRPLIGDQGRLLQVLMNLLSNAIKFTESGSVKLRVRYQSGCTGQQPARIPGQDLVADSGSGPDPDPDPDLGLDHELVTDKQQQLDWVTLHFSVEDTGIGMAADQQARLFQPFTQADTSITRRFGGTGLGLSISQRLVQQMGGQIRLTSVPGEGSKFEFSLCFEQARSDQIRSDDQRNNATASSHKQNVRALKGVRILLVEDQPLNQDVVVGVLRAEGGIVAAVDNGAEALNRLQTEGGRAYDAVLMDVQMPVLDGYETTRRIRDDLGLDDLPIIAMTAHAYADEGRRCRAAGMNDCLIKPVDIEQLFQVLRRCCRPREQTEPLPIATEAAAKGATSLPARLPGMDLNSGLMRAGNDADFYLRLLAQLHDDHQDYPDRIRALIGAGDRNAASQTAHMLVGIALNLGAEEVGNRARKVERAIDTADADLETELTALSASITALGQAIAGLRSDDDAPGADALSDAALREDLRELDALLNERNMRARQQFETLLPRVADPEIRACLETAGRQIDRLDFDAARQTIGALLSPHSPSSTGQSTGPDTNI